MEEDIHYCNRNLYVFVGKSKTLKSWNSWLQLLALWPTKANSVQKFSAKPVSSSHENCTPKTTFYPNKTYLIKTKTSIFFHKSAKILSARSISIIRINVTDKKSFKARSTNLSVPLKILGIIIRCLFF